LDNLAPASLYFGTGNTNIGKNRRHDAGALPVRNQFCIPQGDPGDDNAYPQRLDVLEARDANGKAVATAFFAPSHPVFMMIRHCVSADFISPARNYIEDQLINQGSPAPMAMFFQGFGGDMNPRLFQGNESDSVALSEQATTGEELGADVMRVRTTMTTPLTGPLQARSQKQYIALDPTYNTGYAHNPDTFLPIEEQTLTVGNDANAWNLIAFSHEMLSQHANYVRNSWPNPARVTVAGYSNGVQSYIPNERVIQIDQNDIPSPGTPHNFEGFWTFAYYTWGPPAWTNSDLLSLEKGGSGSNNSLSLNGSNRYVSVPTSDSFSINGPLTLEAWVKLNANNTQQGVIERFGAYNSNSGGYNLRITANGKVHFFIGYDSSNANLYDALDGATVVTTGNWHHLAAVYDGTEMRVYLDGVLDGQKTTSRAPGVGESNLIIGARGYDAGGSYLNGLIDEVRVSANAAYSGNFTPRAHMTAVSGTVGLWKFTGQLSKDFSVEGNHGSLVGGATYSSDVPRDVPASTDNYSLALNVPSAYLDVPNRSSLNITGPVTLEAWIKTNSTTTQQGIIERYKTYGPEIDDGGYALRLTADGKVRFATLKNGHVGEGVTGSTVVTAGEWHHVAGIFEGTLMRVYLDGVIDGSIFSTYAPRSGTGSLKIGARGDDGTYAFNGRIDEARVTAAAVYSATPFTPEAHLSSGTNTRGLWKFDGMSSNDASTNQNDGNLIGGATYSPESPVDTPVTSHSLSLNGTSGYFNVPANDSFNSSARLTLEAWVKLNANNTQQGVIERFGAYNSSSGGYNLRITATGKVHFFIGYDSANSSLYDALDGDTVVTTGAWHHLAAVYDGTEMRVYLDGALDGHKSTTKAPGVGTSNLIIGARGNDAGGSYLNGLIDEVRVTADALYTCPFVPIQHLTPISGTRALWKFDGSSTQDLSGNGNNGSLVGGASFSTSVPGN
jgi:hypothetical protein